MNASTYSYRPATAQDLPAAHALSQRLRWPHREADWALVQRTADGFVAEHEGQLVGIAFACHQGNFSSIGLVIVSDEQQGKGIGRRLRQLCLDATAPRTPILNATEVGAPLYASLGFATFDHIQQHQGCLASAPAAPVLAESHCRRLAPADYPQAIALANAASGLQRDRLLDELLPEALQVMGLERAGELRGLALLRRFGRGLVIGPVVAPDAEAAKALIAPLLEATQGEFVRIDILADCGLADWLVAAGLACVDRAPRMARGTPPRPSGSVRSFALVTQALG
ncbi:MULTISPECIES: GNAT family N-acetyltransferase [unclassified Pseudomonas]|uniref:GNAT family N-acetyltransferase n=1 Tax=unclassified Pseudomonas TaxID=196821 RepID=UPI00131D240F|nr:MULTISPECIES: GNAT family N-acetyltransferase [unclassified Pseudomonas]